MFASRLSLASNFISSTDIMSTDLAEGWIIVNSVDVETNCGVWLDTGSQCARSLACKAHSMKSKRAVPGRSAPYDQLLLAHQQARRSGV